MPIRENHLKLLSATEGPQVAGGVACTCSYEIPELIDGRRLTFTKTLLGLRSFNAVSLGELPASLSCQRACCKVSETGRQGMAWFYGSARGYCPGVRYIPKVL